MYYLIDIQPFTPNLQHFLAGKVIVLYDACCTTYQPSVLRSLGSNPIGQKPARPGPLIFEAVGRLVKRAFRGWTGRPVLSHSPL